MTAKTTAKDDPSLLHNFNKWEIEYKFSNYNRSCCTCVLIMKALLLKIISGI